MLSNQMKDREGILYPAALADPQTYYEAVTMGRRLRAQNPSPESPMGIAYAILKHHIFEFEALHQGAYHEFGDWEPI